MPHQDRITEIFDQQAATYDRKWSRLSPINSTLHLLTTAALAELPAEARVLCVGAGTGAEILHLAKTFPGWRFTAVEPSAPMLEVLRRRAEEAGALSRCELHRGYLDSLPPRAEPFHAATAFLVSQFILEPDARAEFFRSIADRLADGGLLVNSDLAGDTAPGGDAPGLLEMWCQLMRESGTLMAKEEIDRMREAYRRDVAVLPPAEVAAILRRGGFPSPALFFQAGMIHAWFSRKAALPLADLGAPYFI